MSKNRSRLDKQRSARRVNHAFQARLIYFFRRFCWVLGGIIFVLWLGAWFVFSGMGERLGHWVLLSAETQSIKMGCAVQDILVEGRVHTNSELIRAHIPLERGQSIWRFSPQNARQGLEATPWVRRAYVERRLPATIYVRLEEYRPVALWQREGSVFLVDERGIPIFEASPVGFEHLLLVTGLGAPAHIPHLLTLLRAESDLMPLVESALFVGARRWDLRLHNGTVIRLPEKDPEFALHRLMLMHTEKSVLEGSVNIIDLREQDRVIMRVLSPSELLE